MNQLYGIFNQDSVLFSVSTNEKLQSDNIIYKRFTEENKAFKIF